MSTKKLGDIDCLSSDTDTDILHGQQTIEGLEFDDLDVIAGVNNTNTISIMSSTHNTPMKMNSMSTEGSTGRNSLVDVGQSSVNSQNAGQNPQHNQHVQQHNSSFTISGKESPKIPTLTQVYELASNVGHAIEPLTHELGPNRLEHLTKQILPVLSLLENTAQNCQDLFKKEQQLLYDNNNLHKRMKHQQDHFEASELEYHATINQLSDQLECFQASLDNKSSEWDFEVSPVSHVEENLAMALKEAQQKIEQLKLKDQKNRERRESRARSSSRDRINSSSKSANSNESSESDKDKTALDKNNNNNTSPQSGSQTKVSEKQKNLLELNQIIEQKNYYKERCFALEDELRELRGQKHEVLLESQSSKSSLTGLNSNFAQNFANFASGERNLPRSMSTFFTKFTSGVKKAGE